MRSRVVERFYPSARPGKERFPRRLIAERRVAFVKVGPHVRISAAVLADYIAANTVQPVAVRRTRLRRAA
ncbi:DNA-binding protein [Kitasatospora sp. KL5]|uniref:DNA-binding protein n=1 Tax=Kitasatospora sp. KL5 TaxID=3425125 RepID=UPI003D6DD9E9